MPTDRKHLYVLRKKTLHLKIKRIYISIRHIILKLILVCGSN